MNEAIQKLIEAVQKASPVIWQAAYRQVWIDGVENIILLTVFVVAGLLFWKLSQKLRDEIGVFTSRAIAVIAWGLSVPCLISAIDCFANPTFAAIKELKSLL